MTSHLLRLAGIALLFGLTTSGGSAAEAASLGANLGIRTMTLDFPQTAFAGSDRLSNVDDRTTTTPPLRRNLERPVRMHAKSKSGT
jgi:hypothetical protein